MQQYLYGFCITYLMFNQCVLQWSVKKSLKLVKLDKLLYLTKCKNGKISKCNSCETQVTKVENNVCMFKLVAKVERFLVYEKYIIITIYY